MRRAGRTEIATRAKFLPPITLKIAYDTVPIRCISKQALRKKFRNGTTKTHILADASPADLPRNLLIVRSLRIVRAQ